MVALFVFVLLVERAFYLQSLVGVGGQATKYEGPDRGGGGRSDRGGLKRNMDGGGSGVGGVGNVWASDRFPLLRWRDELRGKVGGSERVRRGGGCRKTS